MKRKSKGWQLSLIGLSSLSLGCNEKGVYKAGHPIFIVQCKFLECSFLSKLNLHSLGLGSRLGWSSFYLSKKER